MPENRRFYTVQECREVYELTREELRDGVDKRTLQKAKNQNMGSYYQGITGGGILEWETTSVTTDGKKTWKQEVKLLDLDDALYIGKRDEDMSDNDIVNLAINGDLAVHCECPAWLYWGYQYMGWQMDYSLKRQNIKPDQRNPKREGTVCKHLYNVFTVMPFNISRIAKDMRDRGMI